MTTMEKLRQQARQELVYADELLPAYRDFLFSLVPDFKPPARPRETFNRLFAAAGDRRFDPAPQPESNGLFGDRLREATATKGNRKMDKLFSGG